jgi:hypothetical protein
VFFYWGRFLHFSSAWSCVGSWVRGGSSYHSLQEQCTHSLLVVTLFLVAACPLLAVAAIPCGVAWDNKEEIPVVGRPPLKSSSGLGEGD